MSDDKKSRFLTNLFNTKARYLGLDKENVEVNVENNMSILEDVFDDDIIEDALNDN